MAYRSIRSRFAVFFLAFSLILLCIPASVPVFADRDDLGSITITCQTEDTFIAGMQWNLFLVAERNENYAELMAAYMQQNGTTYTFDSTVPQPNVYHTVGQFAGSHVMLNDLSESAMERAASTLENEAVLRHYIPDASARSDENGEVYFPDVPQGLYLLVGKSLQLDEITTVIPGAFLVEIISDSILENLHITSTPKLEYYNLSGEDTRMMVRKVWLNEPGKIRDQNAYIVVNIYKDGELFNTVTLNEANNWRTSWTGQTDCEWRVEEVVVPDEYTVVYLANDTQFLIENTYTPWYDSSSTNDEWRKQETTTTATGTTAVTTATETVTTGQTTGTDQTTLSGSTSNGQNGGGSVGSTAGKPGGTGNSGSAGGSTKLPQTGQLWWPVPFLCLGGIVCVMIGWQLLRREEQG